MDKILGKLRNSRKHTLTCADTGVNRRDRRAYRGRRGSGLINQSPRVLGDDGPPSPRSKSLRHPVARASVEHKFPRPDVDPGVGDLSGGDVAPLLRCLQPLLPVRLIPVTGPRFPSLAS